MGTDNIFYENNNLDVLKQMEDKSIDLIYMDPPFNSKRKQEKKITGRKRKQLMAYFESKNWKWKPEYERPSFRDVWKRHNITDQDVYEVELQNEKLADYLRMVEKSSISGYVYLTFMSLRILECKRVLKENGVLLYHCDQSMSHYIKIMLDIIFGTKGYVNNIAWCYTGPANHEQTGFSNKYDEIFVYTPGQKKKITWRWNNPWVGQGYSESSIKAFTSESSWGDRSKYADGLKFPENYFTDIPALKNTAENVGYPTQKPLKLLKRLIVAFSKPGDIIMDPFCGCATTCVATELLNEQLTSQPKRRWIGIDKNPIAIKLVQYRIDKEIHKWTATKSSLSKNDGVRYSQGGSFGTKSFDFISRNEIIKEEVKEINRKEEWSHVYVCQEEHNGVTYPEKKIGKADNLERRLKTLNGTLSPTKTIFAAAWKVKNGLGCEKKMHEIFAGRRVIGEWFVDDNNEMIDMINAIMPLFEGERVI